MKLPAILWLSILFILPARGYDPMSVAAGGAGEPLDFSVSDAERQRELPIRVYMPVGKASAPVVLFSHGLGGSRENNPYLGRHWSGRGYTVVFVQHPGSDESVWKGVAPLRLPAALKQAASGQNLLLRVADIPAVLDQLERWQAEPGHALQGRLDLKRVGMSGHSFGAVTTQAVSGQSLTAGGARFTDPRIRAALAMSPSVPAVGDAGRAFGDVKIPWLLMTGTADVARIGGTTLGPADVASRLAVYPALPEGDKYELVLEGAAHHAFGDRALPGEGAGRNPNHHRVILALSTAFWDAYLRDDPAAKAWLQGDGARSVLEAGDRWQRK